MQFCRVPVRIPDMTVTQMGEAGSAASERVRRNVEVLMRLNGTTQQKLARDIGMSRPTIQKRLADGEWKVTEIGRLAAYYGIPESVFYEDPENLLRTLSNLGFRPSSCTDLFAAQLLLPMAS